MLQKQVNKRRLLMCVSAMDRRAFSEALSLLVWSLGVLCVHLNQCRPTDRRRVVTVCRPCGVSWRRDGMQYKRPGDELLPGRGLTSHRSPLAMHEASSQPQDQLLGKLAGAAMSARQFPISAGHRSTATSQANQPFVPLAH